MAGIIYMCFGAAILYGARYFYQKNSAESIGVRKFATFLFLCAGLGAIYMGIQNIRCQIVTTPYCTVWNTPTPRTHNSDGGSYEGSYSSDSDYSSSSSSDSSSSSYDGGGGSSNGGGYGD
jgi:uncharacterized membrane protein YgcG